MNSALPEKTKLEHALEERDRRGPAWRWDLAGEWLHRRPGPMLRQLGRDFLDVQHYQTLCAHSQVGRKQALALYPAIAAAEELHADTRKTGHLKVAVLGEIDLGEVSPQIGIDRIVAQAWEMAFYDVRGTRSAVDWVHIRLIKPELAAGNADLAARLRMAAAVGTAGARAILKADTRLPIREAEKLFARQLKLSLKFDAALETMPDTTETRLFFIRQHSRLMFEKERLKLAREKLERKCAEALDRYELAKIRAEIALERERSRTAARIRRAEKAALAQVGEEQAGVWLAARRRKQEVAEEAATAARIAASPLSRLKWRHREKEAEFRPAQDVRSVARSASAPLAILLPRNPGITSVSVPA